jgi:hypothetical protein
MRKFYPLSEKQRLMITGAIYMEHQIYKRFNNKLTLIEFLWPDRSFSYEHIAKNTLQNLDLAWNDARLSTDEAEFVIEVITWTQTNYMKKVETETLKANPDPIYLEMFQFVSDELNNILVIINKTLNP